MTVLEMTTMRIGELAERTGVSRRSLRYYEQQGLISARRAANGYREYDELAAVRAANIRDLLNAGLALDDIRPSLEKGCLDRPLTDTPECAGTAVQVAEHRLEKLDRQIASLTAYRERLVERIDHQRQLVAARTESPGATG